MCRKIIIYIALILATFIYANLGFNLGFGINGIIASILVVVFCYLFCSRYILKKNQTAALNYIQTMTNIPEDHVGVSGFIRPTIRLHNQQRVSWDGSFMSIGGGLHGVKFKKNTLIGYSQDTTAGRKVDYVYYAPEQAWTFPAIIRDLEGETH